jgi:hypothetical protein
VSYGIFHGNNMVLQKFDPVVEQNSLIVSGAKFQV